MQLILLKSKIHMAKVSDTQVYYEGSIAIDKKLMAASGMVKGEKVLVIDFNNGNRFETYVIEGDDGEISLKGPAAKLCKKNDKVIIMAFGLVEESQAKSFKAKVVHVNDRNEIK